VTGLDCPTPFTVTVVRRHGRTALRLSGELDIASAPRLARAIAELFDTDPPDSIAIEAEQLEFADVVGLRPLFDLAERLGPGAMQIKGARRPVARVFQLLERTEMLA
jgi:anti-anti-sigma factor